MLLKKESYNENKQGRAEIIPQMNAIMNML